MRLILCLGQFRPGQGFVLLHLGGSVSVKLDPVAVMAAAQSAATGCLAKRHADASPERAGYRDARGKSQERAALFSDTVTRIALPMDVRLARTVRHRHFFIVDTGEGVFSRTRHG